MRLCRACLLDLPTDTGRSQRNEMERSNEYGCDSPMHYPYSRVTVRLPTVPPSTGRRRVDVVAEFDGAARVVLHGPLHREQRSANGHPEDRCVDGIGSHCSERLNGGVRAHAPFPLNECVQALAAELTGGDVAGGIDDHPVAQHREPLGSRPIGIVR